MIVASSVALAAVAGICPAVPQAERRLIFEEKFGVGHRKWSERDDDVKAIGIRDGRYVMEIRKPKASWMVWRNSALRDDIDYRVEATFQPVSGEKSSSYGLLFGVDSDQDFHAFFVRRDGAYTLYSKERGKVITRVAWTSVPEVRRGNGVTNELAVERRGHRLHLFINGREVGSAPSVQLFASNLGMMVSLVQKTEIPAVRAYEIGAAPEPPRPPPSTAEVLFEDDFMDNRNDWPVGDTEINRKRIEAGHYLLEVRQPDKSWFVWKKPVRLRDDWPFRIEVEIEKRSGVLNFAYGFHFGLRDVGNYLAFRITGDGRYGFARTDEKTSYSLIDFTASPAIRRGNGATNHVAIQKQQDRFFLFINGEFVDRLPAQRSFGDYLGFHVYDQQRIHVRHLKVLQWSPEEPSTPAQNDQAPVILAVFEVGDPSGATKTQLRQQLTEYLGAVLAQSGRFELVPQAMMRKEIQAAKTDSFRACYDTSCQIELGKALAAQAVLTTKILRVEKTCVVTSKLFDLAKETTTKAATVETGCGDAQLLKAMTGVAAKL